MSYICPVCKNALDRAGDSYKCRAGHSYDISASGYVNLSGAGKASRGDDADMVSARRRFLQTERYKPLCDEVLTVLGRHDFTDLLDAGCGEGYYTKRISEAFPDKRIYGLDISKKAAEKAARSCKTANICVASSYDMPYADGSFDAVVNIFSPLSLDEYKRVLVRGGALVVAVPRPDHLIELKQAVYENVFVKEMKDAELDGFESIGSTDVRFVMDLDSDELNDLFMMTPYYHKTSYEDKEKLKNHKGLDVTASFTVFEYIRR